MPTEPDLLLIRLAELKQDVEHIQGVVTTARRRQERLDDLRKRGTGVRIGLTGARKMLLELSDELSGNDAVLATINDFEVPGAVRDRVAPGFDEDELSWLDSLGRLMEILRNDVFAIVSTLDDLDRAMLVLGGTDDFNKRCQDAVAEIEEITRQLTAGTTSRAALWAALDGLLETSCRDLFTDYVDMLAGLTLRDNGLEDEISVLNDALMDELTTQLKAVPVGPADVADRAPRPLPGSLVKLWFPEWTIWDVPLLGYEAGLAWTQISPLGQELVADGGERPGLRSLVATAYAAYALGPAYACAAVLLRLRPPGASTALPNRDIAPDPDRVHVMITVLRAMSGTAGGGIYPSIVDTVDSVWRAAVRERGGADEPARLAELDELTERILRTLRQIATFKGFDAQLWEAQSRGPYEALLAAPQSTGRAGTPLVRGVLNAAWAARLERQVDAAGTVADIAVAAKRMVSRRPARTERRPGDRSRISETRRTG